MIGPSQSRPDGKLSLAAALGAFLVWGFAPLYFKAVGEASAWEIVAHRIVWTAIMMAALLMALGRLSDALDPLRSPRRFATYLGTTFLVTANWTIYLWAVLHGFVVESSLGYYINPLVNVLLGVLFLSERLTRPQLVAIGLAGVGVLISIIDYGRPPLIALGLAFSFGLYALMRKKEQVEPLAGLFVETLILAPFALAMLVVLAAAGTGTFGPASIGGLGLGFSIMLICSGIVTGVPLILFMIGARGMTLSAIGLLQYLAPSIQLALAVTVFGERTTPATWATFAFIWAGLAIFSWDAVRRYRGGRRQGAATEAVGT